MQSFFLAGLQLISLGGEGSQVPGLELESCSGPTQCFHLKNGCTVFEGELRCFGSSGQDTC